MNREVFGSCCLFLVLFFVSNISFAQFDLQSMELKAVKGRVVSPDQKPVSNVQMKKLRTNLGTTDKKGGFSFNINVQKGSRNLPVIVFSKKGYDPVKWKYDYSTYKEVVLYPIGYEEAVNKLVENAIEDDVVVEKKEVSETPVSGNKNVPSPVVYDAIKEDLSIKSATLTNEKINKKELEELKKYISYLEEILKENKVDFNAESLGQKSFYDKEVAQQISELKEKVDLKEKELVKSEDKRKRLWWVILVIVLILIPSILAIVFFINGKKTKKLNVQLEDQVEEIQQANEEIAAQRDDILEKSTKLNEAYTSIRASVMYAKRIQESILINPVQINSHFNDSFIYYQPKDIVSGDFYWFSSIDDKLIIAAIDCTGHGVPGAFMTMLSNTLLNEIVNNKRITDPSLILKALHEQVREHLHQEKENSAKDGMDIALVVIDSIAKELSFAGANNPFYFIDSVGCQQVRGSKSGIGGGEADVSFETTSWRLDQFSTFYLFSDGFQDQFGGEKSKKYMKKNFREYLYSISTLSMSAQKESLDKELNDWMGENEQTDDVLVIGVKL